MRGITFDDVHTSDFGIYLKSVTVGEAKVKDFHLDIPGTDGSLDMTEFFGMPLYENRKLIFEFTFPQRDSELLTAYSEFQRAVHGKKANIILDDEPKFHYVGRVNVGQLKKDVISTVTVECDCEPYKYSNTSDTVEIVVDSVEFLPEWVYGDITGSGTVDSSDLGMMVNLVGKKSFESENALRADFDYDGVVTEAEVTALSRYIALAPSVSFKDYILANPDLLIPKYSKRAVIDFGAAPVDVTFNVKEITGTRLWELRIDNIPYFEHIHGYKSFTERLSGVHEVMIVTANHNTTGVFEVTWKGRGEL